MRPGMITPEYRNHPKNKDSWRIKMSEKMKAIKDDLVKAFSTGVSYMMPVVVVGGICLALS
jgi:PTS system fructose-specific IIC component/fructose-specific PTS system IIC-like component